MTYALNINKLNKTYFGSKKSPKKVALKDVDLKVKKGSFFGLLGPNGAGKSTLINILAGLVNKTSGEVKISGVDIDENSKLAKFKIGIVPQEIVIDPFFSVRQTLDIYAGYFGIKKQDNKTEEIIKALGLEDKIDAKPRSLSGGMKRRLLIAKALVHSPDILILDEPTAGVDVELRNQLWDYVKKLNEQGTTIILTTHYLEEAEELCDEIAVINNGEVIACDKKENLMSLLSRKELLVTLEDVKKDVLDKVLKDLDYKLLAQDKIAISYDPKEIRVENVMKNLLKSEIIIKDISTSQPDLEEVFKFLINFKK